MTRRRLLGLVLTAVLLGGGLGACGGDERAGTGRRPSSGTTGTSGTLVDADAYVGLTKKAAIAKAAASDTPWRITREDDELFLVTQDYNPERLNFEIDDGRVTEATYG